MANEVRTENYPNGNTYTGEFDGDKKQGHGIYTWVNGLKYEGNFENDKINGTGTIYHTDGSVYKGEWKDENKCGKGEFIWKNGHRYVGEFAENKRNGHGIMYFADGRIYEGEWKDDVQCGFGELRIPDSAPEGLVFGNGEYDMDRHFTGTWKNGLLDGAVDEWHCALPYPALYSEGKRLSSYLDLSEADSPCDDLSTKGKFLGQSGFWLQLPDATLIFDFYRGSLPPTRKDKPVIVFITSHRIDHFNSYIFNILKTHNNVSFVIGQDDNPDNNFENDIKEYEKEFPDLDDRCFFIRGGSYISFRNINLTVHALYSLDLGVAFGVEINDKTIFHSGSLWIQDTIALDKEGKLVTDSDIIEQVKQMGLEKFKSFTSPLNERKIDFAMLPLDPRFGDNGERSMEHYLSIADIKSFVPMYFWENYDYLDKYIENHPESSKCMIKPVIKDKNDVSDGVLQCTSPDGFFSLEGII